MSDQTDMLADLFTNFGLTKDQALVYLYLLENGGQTPLQLSKNMRFARTRIYRIGEKLLNMGLLSQKDDGKSIVFEANPHNKLDIFVKEKENELEMLRQSRDTIYKQLDRLPKIESGSSKVFHYKGLEGLKQVTLNSLSATDEILMFEVNEMNVFLDFNFAEKIRAEQVNRKIKVRELTSRKEIESWTELEAFVANWECRYTDPEILEMKIEMLIYNDTCAFYNTEGREVFCIEIHNQDIADMHKQIFNLVWKSSHPMKVVGMGGESKVI